MWVDPVGGSTSSRLPYLFLNFLVFLQVGFWFGPYSKPLFQDSALRLT